jgi:isoquinoline 1-oxidoreductase
MSMGDSSRRDFLATGTGLFVFLHATTAHAQEPERLPTRMGYPTDFNAWMRIGADGRVTCFAGKVELGQGAMTSLAQCLAEELDVPFDSVDMVMGDTDLCPWDMGTFGSMTTPLYVPVLRAAAAEARAVLLGMAAERLQTPVARLKVSAGAVADPANGKRVTYAQLVEGRRIEHHIDHIPVKSPEGFSVLGKPVRRKDAMEKVTGRARYAGDMRLPGMLCARILRPPAHGATLKSVDTGAVKGAGVQVVRDGDFVAVLHERRDVADAALDQVKAEFDHPRGDVDDVTIFDHLLKTAPPPGVVAEAGHLADGEKLAAAVVEEVYRNAYVAHAPTETHSALANLEGDRITVWASTQAPFAVKRQVAGALHLPEANVRVISVYVGGGFGGKSDAPQAVEAARLAKATGRPVQVTWDRAEEFFYDSFRPAAVVKVRSGLTSANRIAFWDFQVYGAGDREANHFYDIPHHRTTSVGGWMGGNSPGFQPLAVGPWRAPSVNTNTFARESHIDTLARRAGVDPLEFRLQHLSDQRMRRVLEAAAGRFGWKAAKAPSGRGVGVACGVYSQTRVAAMAEVTVDGTSGRVLVKRVVLALDEGLTLNPDGTRQQIEGAITMGLGYSLTEEVRFQGGEVLNRNFDSYEIPRFSWAPKIDTVVIDNPGRPAQGCGEPPIITTGAVLANAIYDATGARVTQLPMTRDRILTAMKRHAAEPVRPLGG